ncbi:MAG: hypothetical protein N4A31_06985 [Rickettsiales bacterium]|jgi:hypothetical protein|nr:hypothetical protein [Rickettsiales bacterium]
MENTQESYPGDQTMTSPTPDLPKLTFNNIYQHNYSPYIYAAASFIILGATYYRSYKFYTHDDSGTPNPISGLSTIVAAATKTAHSYVKGFLGATAIAASYNQDDNDDKDIIADKIPAESFVAVGNYLLERAMNNNDSGDRISEFSGDWGDPICVEE